MIDNSVRTVRQVIRVKDGDTFVMLSHLGFHVFGEITVRLNGWDAPELRTPDGPAAKERAEQILSEGTVTIRNVGRSFERWACDVWVNGTLFVELMEREGHRYRRWPRGFSYQNLERDQ